MIKKNKEFLILILILLSGIIIFALLVLFQWIGEYIYTLDHFWWFLISYIAGGILFYFLQSNLKYQIFKQVFKIWIFPITEIVSIIHLSVPLFVIQIHLMYYVLISISIPVALYFTDKLYDLTVISNGLYTYFILTFSVIVGTIFNNQIKHLVYIISPFRIYYSEKLKKYKFKELTDYLISGNNVRFMIYISYFIYLLLFNIFNLQNQNLYSNAIIDKAVLQSFITFIAFDNVLKNFKNLEFKPSELLNRILLSITGEDKKEEKTKEPAGNII